MHTANTANEAGIVGTTTMP